MQHSVVNVFLIGPLGAGKSTIGKRLAKALNFEFIDTDQEIIKRSGADITWIFDIEGEQGYRRRETNIIKEVSKKKGVVLATGGGAVLLEENRRNIVSYSTVVYLRTNLEKQYQRLEKDTRRPVLQDTMDLNSTLKKLDKERLPYYERLADMTIDTDVNNIQKVVSLILKKLKE